MPEQQIKPYEQRLLAADAVYLTAENRKQPVGCSLRRTRRRCGMNMKGLRPLRVSRETVRDFLMRCAALKGAFFRIGANAQDRSNIWGIAALFAIEYQVVSSNDLLSVVKQNASAKRYNDHWFTNVEFIAETAEMKAFKKQQSSLAAQQPLSLPCIAQNQLILGRKESDTIWILRWKEANLATGSMKIKLH